MNALAIDTSGEALGLCLASGDQEQYCVSHRMGLRHAQTVMVWIDRLLEEAQLSPTDLELIACCSGPGSFTGVRIGLATAKGLSLAVSCPLVTVTSLDALAARYGHLPGTVVPVIDARKGRFYAAMYHRGSRTSDYLDLSAEDLLSRFAPMDPICLIGPHAAALGSVIGDTQPDIAVASMPTYTDPAALLQLGLQKLAAEGPEDLGAVPVYVRRSEAETTREEKEGNAHTD